MVGEVVDKMFNMNSISQLSRDLADYRTENQVLLTRAKKVKEFLIRFKKFSHLEAEDIGGGFFSFNSNLKEIVGSLDVNIDPAIAVIEKLIENLEKEKKDLDKYFDKLKNSSIDAIKQIESLLINYNKNQYDLMQELNTYIPNVVELTQRAIAMEEEAFSQSAGKFIGMYKGLVKVLAAGKNADKLSLYESVEGIVENLEKFAGGYSSEFKQGLSSAPNTLRFVENYYGNLKTKGRELAAWKKKAGRYEDKSKTYGDVDKDDKEKLDKFFKDLLEKLFEGITERINESEVDIKKQIGVIIRVETDFKELEGKFIEKYNAVSNKIQDEFNYVFSGDVTEKVISLDDLYYEFTDYGSDDTPKVSVKFKEFRKKYLKSDKKFSDVIKEANRVLGTFISSKKSLESFLETQVLRGVIVKAGKKVGGGSDDEISSEDKKLIRSFYDAINGVHDWETLEEESKIFIIQDMSDLLSLLFGGKPHDVIVYEDGSYHCDRFVAVCNSFGKKAHDLHIETVLRECNAKLFSDALLKHDFVAWKKFMVLISFLFN